MVTDKGFNLLCAAKRQWGELGVRHNLLAQARDCFEQSLTALPDSAMVLGNLAYSTWLQGDAAIAQSKFVAALAAPEGGEALYDGTLGDLDI